MKLSLVSIIMPVKNGANYIEEALVSIYEQDYKRFEVIIVDGHSEDATAKIAGQFPVNYILQEGKPGIAAAKNLGLGAARGELVAFSSHDDVWLKHKLSRQVDFMIRNPEIRYTLTHIKFFLEPGCEIPPGFKSELLEGDHIGAMPETLVADKALFSEIGDFKTDFTYIEDVDWFVRAKENKIPAAVIPEVLLLKRIHQGNGSYSTAKAGEIRQDIFNLLRRSIRNKRDSGS